MIGVFSHILESVNLTNAFKYYHGEPARKGFNPRIAGGWDEELYSKDIDTCIKNDSSYRYTEGKDKYILHLYTMGEDYSSIYLGSINVRRFGDNKFDWEWNEQEPITQEQINYLRDEVQNEAARINDEGKTVPEVCPKCGAKVNLVFRGEPIWLCSNKDCEEYFGVKPFKENAINEYTYDSGEGFNDYILNGNAQYAISRYKGQAYSMSKYIPSFTLPDFINKSVLEKAIYDTGEKHYHNFWSKNKGFQVQGDSPFKFFRLMDCHDENLNTIVFKHSKGFESWSTKLYQYNIKGKRKYSRYTAIIVTVKEEIKAIYVLPYDNDFSIKVPIKKEMYSKNKTVEESAMFDINSDIPDIPFLCSYNISGLAMDILNELSGPGIDDAGADTGDEENFDMPADGGEGGEDPEPANMETDDAGTEDNMDNNDDEENYDVNDDTEGDDTGEEDTGENNEEENPEGGEEDENFDLPEDGEGEIDTTGGEDEGLDNGNNDTAMDGGLDQTKSKLQEIEDQIFDDLSDVDKANKTQELKKLFMDLHANCTNIIEMVDDMPKNEDMLKITEFINKSLEDTKQYILDYISNTFDSKSYMENMAEFQKYIAVLYSIRNVLDELKPNTSK